jgi:hypothetical protein
LRGKALARVGTNVDRRLSKARVCRSLQPATYTLGPTNPMATGRGEIRARNAGILCGTIDGANRTPYGPAGRWHLIVIQDERLIVGGGGFSSRTIASGQGS